MDVANLNISIKTSGVSGAKNDLNNLDNAAKRAKNSAEQFRGTILAVKAAVAALAGSALIKEFVQTADAMSNMNSRLKMATSSMSEFLLQQKAMHALARETHSDIEDTTNLYVKLAPALKDLGKSTSEINDMVSSFTKALKLGGASAEESAAAIKQFGQAMGSGALRGDEFNSIAEASPTLLRYMAEGLGVNVGELRKLGSEGKLTAEALSDAFSKMKETIDEDFSQLPVTVGSAFTDLKTEIALTIDEFNNANGITQNLSAAIKFFADAIKDSKDTIVGFVNGVISFAKHLGILAATFYAVKRAKAAYMALSTPFVAQISAGTIQLGLMDRALMSAGVTLGSVKAAVIGLKTAFMGFLPTLAVYAAVEAFLALKDSMDEAGISADKLNQILNTTNAELSKLSQNKRDLYNMNLQESLDADFKKRNELQKKLDADRKYGGLNSYFKLSDKEKLEIKNQIEDINEQIHKTVEKRKEISKINLGLDASVDQEKKDDAYLNSLQKKISNLHITTIDDLKKDLANVRKEMAEEAKKPADTIRTQVAQEEYLNKLKIKEKEILDKITKEETKSVKDLNSAYLEIAQSGMSEFDKARDNIMRKTQQWLKDGIDPEKVAYYRKNELKKIDLNEAKQKLAGRRGLPKDTSEQDAKKAERERIRQINEELKLKDRMFDLQKRAADLSYSEVEKNQKLVTIEYERAQASYKALLDKKEISKQFYDEAMALEERLYQKQMFDASEWGRVMESGLSGIENAMSNFLDYSSDGFLKFGDLAKSVLGEIYKALVRELIISQMIAAIRRGVSGLFGGVGGAANAGAGAGMAGAIGNAQGGVYAGAGLHAYANSIVSKPTFFAFANGGIPNLGVMGERNGGSPEAIMPLTRTSSGDLGVRAQLSNIKIEVINQTKEDAQVTNTQVRQDPEGYVVSLVMSGYAKNKNGIRDMLRK